MTSHSVFGRKVWYLKVDPELKLVHTASNCPEARVAFFYNYLEDLELRTAEDARKLDQRGLKPCPRCLKKEMSRAKHARREKYVPPPGFRQPMAEDGQ